MWYAGDAYNQKDSFAFANNSVRVSTLFSLLDGGKL
jgi:hypothetical protein